MRLNGTEIFESDFLITHFKVTPHQKTELIYLTIYAVYLTRSGQYRRHICEFMTSDPP